MMKKIVSVCTLSIIFSSFSHQSNATLIDVNWNTANDSALLLDTSSGLQWLDLSITANQSYNQVQTLLQQGGTYEGFRYATRDEVLHLWSEANVSDTNFTWVINGEWQNIKDLADRPGTSTLFDPHGLGTHALGMVEGELQLPANERRVMEISYHSNAEEVRTSSEHYVLELDYASIHYSSYLVRTSPVWGDINDDGNVNAADVLLATQAAFGATLSNEQLTRGNVALLINGLPQPVDPHAALDVADLLLITQKALGTKAF